MGVILSEYALKLGKTDALQRLGPVLKRAYNPRSWAHRLETWGSPFRLMSSEVQQFGFDALLLVSLCHDARPSPGPGDFDRGYRHVHLGSTSHGCSSIDGDLRTSTHWRH